MNLCLKDRKMMNVLPHGVGGLAFDTDKRIGGGERPAREPFVFFSGI
jgi:hypothetical protein